jgi:hypothetical protein
MVAALIGWRLYKRSDCFAAREEMGDQRNHGDDQQQVNYPAGYVECEKARSPQAQQNQKQY